MNQTNGISNKELADLAGWEIARNLGCHYHGDANPIRHGGFFYDARDWQEQGYASCVEFWEDPESGYLVVQRGTIHKCEDMAGAFACIGISPDDAARENIHCQIEASRACHGIEPDGTRYPDLKTYNLDHWTEWRLWKSVREWITALGN